MAWSSTAPTLPSGVSWGNSQTKTEQSNHDTTKMTVTTARGVGTTYYVRLEAYYTKGSYGDYSRPTHYLVPGYTSITGAGEWGTNYRYYTGTGSPGTLRVGMSSASNREVGSLFVNAVIPAVRTYAVTYNGNGNTGGSTASQTKTEGTALTLQSNGFTKDGYVFVEWNTSSDGTGTSYAEGASYTANAALTLYAIWQRAAIPVYLNDNGTMKQATDMYYNDNGTVKKGTLYYNNNGTIVEVS